MAEKINILMRKFSNVRLLDVSDVLTHVRFDGWCDFFVCQDGGVLEVVNGSGRTSTNSQWLEAILAGAKRDDSGVMIHG